MDCDEQTGNQCPPRRSLAHTTEGVPYQRPLPVLCVNTHFPFGFVLHRLIPINPRDAFACTKVANLF